MKKWLLVLFLALFPFTVSALPVPPLVAHTNDYAGILSAPTKQELERELTQFEKTDSTQIVVLTIRSLEGENLEEYSIKVAEAWKVGRKGVDNGAILLIARDERKIRIEVGRGLEGKLTDLVSGQIIRNRIAPKFKAGDFDAGVKDGVHAIMEVVRGEFKGAEQTLRHPKKSATPIFTLLIFLFVALVFAGAISKVLGAVTGSVGLPVAAKLSFPFLSLSVLGGLAVLGLVTGLLLSALFSAGGRPGRGGRGGGFWGGPFIGGGGWGSGGGGDSGGFSGGGGDFGGGGASGDW
jgi:uncharacterized protein